MDYLVQQVGSFLSGTHLTSIPPQVVQQAFNYRTFSASLDTVIFLTRF